MIGVYDYTVLFTYLSLVSSVIGIFFTIQGNPVYGVLCIMLSGFFVFFDGKIASLKRNRTDLAKKFGIQIDSLADLVAFGVLPSCVGFCLLKQSVFFQEFCNESIVGHVIFYGSVVILIFYLLAALIRLAYYNVTEVERQKQETGSRSYFVGLPVTSSSVVFPMVFMISKIFSLELAIVYFITMIIVGFAFILKFSVKEPQWKGLLIIALLGMVEFFFFLFYCVF